MIYDVNIGDTMTRYALNLPKDLKREAEELASAQGISLNQFIMWSVSEKVASLRQNLDDPNFPGITYRRGASGWVTPILRGSNIRVQTLITDLDNGMTDQEIVADYELRPEQIREARAFYNAHQHEIDASIQREQQIEAEHGVPKTSP